ncbi:hypothetical protein PSYMO_37047, partial [Pseudomonas amygdali pv. mori str. 301020]
MLDYCSELGVPLEVLVNHANPVTAGVPGPLKLNRVVVQQ